VHGKAAAALNSDLQDSVYFFTATTTRKSRTSNLCSLSFQFRIWKNRDLSSLISAIAAYLSWSSGAMPCRARRELCLRQQALSSLPGNMHALRADPHPSADLCEPACP
jgi:hypothetical protein